MNPLTRLFIYLLFSFSILFSKQILIILAHIALLLIILLYKKELWSEWVKYTKPYYIYFPLSGILFLCISLVISQRSLELILVDVILATIRLSFTVSIMTLYMIESRSDDILLAIRGLWFSSGIQYRWLDRLLLFFEITMRFFPSIQEQWNITERSQKALTIKKPRSRIQRTINIAKFIPDFIILNLEKTDNIVHNMLMRGYGINSPRSIYPHIKFRLYDCIIFAGLLVVTVGVHSFD